MGHATAPSPLLVGRIDLGSLDWLPGWLQLVLVIALVIGLLIVASSIVVAYRRDRQFWEREERGG